MKPGLPFTLGFTPDDGLIVNIANTVVEQHIDHAIALSVIKQLLDSVTSDFVNDKVGADPSLYDFLTETDTDAIFTACYATYRPGNCLCLGKHLIFFQLYFYSEDYVNFDIIDIGLVDESILEFMPKRDFHPTAEDREKALKIT